MKHLWVIAAPDGGIRPQGVVRLPIGGERKDLVQGMPGTVDSSIQGGSRTVELPVT